MTDSIEQRERERFEAAMRTAKSFHAGVLERDANGEYMTAITEAAWQGWRMCAALSAPQAGVPAIPEFDSLDHEVIAAACGSAGLFRWDFRAAWEKVRSMLEAAPPAPGAPAQEPRKPDAWGVVAEVDGNMVLQYPVHLYRKNAEHDAGMYQKGVKIEIQPMYLGAPAQVPAPGDSGAEPSDTQLWATFMKDSGGPNPFYRCIKCGKVEPGLREYLVAHWQRHEATQPTKPSKAAPVLLSEESIDAAWEAEKVNSADRSLPRQWLRFARSIESAVLRANGIGGE